MNSFRILWALANNGVWCWSERERLIAWRMQKNHFVAQAQDGDVDYGCCTIDIQIAKHIVRLFEYRYFDNEICILYTPHLLSIRAKSEHCAKNKLNVANFSIFWREIWIWPICMRKVVPNWPDSAHFLKIFDFLFLFLTAQPLIYWVTLIPLRISTTWPWSTWPCRGGRRASPTAGASPRCQRRRSPTSRRSRGC